MKRFFFSDIIPTKAPTNDSYSMQQIREEFLATCDNYKNVYSLFPQIIERGIVTEKQPGSTFIYETSLLELIKSSIQNDDLRSYIFSAFQKYPLESVISEDIILEELYAEHTLTFAGQSFDSLMFKLAHREKGALFTIPFCNEIKNTFLIYEEVPSLHGGTLDDFCSLVRNEILENTTDNFEKLKLLCENSNFKVIYTPNFERSFKQLVLNLQDVVLEHVERCLTRGYFTTPDNGLVKVEKGRVWAIRIFTPVIRIYLEVVGEKIYFASLYDDHQDRIISQYINDAEDIIARLKAETMS